MRAGLRPSFSWAVYIMAVLLIVIFIGFMNHFRSMYYQGDDVPDASGTKSSLWCTVPMWLALVPILILGVWWPDAIWSYVTSIAHMLSVGAQ